jgi:predicted acylesterase/phospholipase RssA
MSAEVHTAFVLGGGGILGSAEVGMLRALLERDIVPDLVVGSSVGALNGAFIAADPSTSSVDRMVDLWTGLSERGVFGESVFGQISTLARHGTHLHTNDGLRRVLDEGLGKIAFADLAVRFQCVAACIERAATQWFTSGSLTDAVLASCAVPGLLPAVEIDGEHFLDGGLVRSVPIGRAAELGAQRIFVLHVGRLEQPLRPANPPLAGCAGRIRDRTPAPVRRGICQSARDRRGPCPAERLPGAHPLRSLSQYRRRTRSDRCRIRGCPHLPRSPSTPGSAAVVVDAPAACPGPFVAFCCPWTSWCSSFSRRSSLSLRSWGSSWPRSRPAGASCALLRSRCAYCLVELAAMTALGILWLRRGSSGPGRPRDRTRLDRGPRSPFGVGPRPGPRRGTAMPRLPHRRRLTRRTRLRSQGTDPVLVLARHGGPGDSFALVHLLLTRYHRGVRIVLKDILQIDPLIDLLLNRLGCCFLLVSDRGRR